MFRITASALTAAALLSGALVISQSVEPVKAQAAAGSCPAISGHRGSPQEAPENTLQGIVAAKDGGAQYVEMDVVFDKTNYPRLMHDTTVDRTTNGTGAASAVDFNTMEKLSAADFGTWKTDPEFAGWTDAANTIPKTKVPRAYDFFSTSRWNSIIPLLDMKAAPTTAKQAELLLQYITHYNHTSSIIIMGSEATVKKMRTYPGFANLTYALIEFPAATTVDVPATNVKHPEYLKALGVKYYTLAARHITSSEFVDSYAEAGVDMISWVTEPGSAKNYPWENVTTYQKLADAGVKIITTDKPRQAAAWALTAAC